MKEYKGEPIDDKKSIRETFNERKNKINYFKNKLSKMNPSNPDYTKVYNYIQKLENNLNKMKMRFAAVILTGTIAISGIIGGTAGIITHNLNKNLNEDIQNASKIVELQDGVIGVDGSATQKNYEDFKDKLLKYSKLLDLKNADSLTWEQKKEMSDLKKFIKDNPEELNNLALEIVKTKIAEKINLDDPGKIHVRYYKNGISTRNGTGNITEISVSVKENEDSNQLTPVASYEDFASISNPDDNSQPDYGDFSADFVRTLAIISANQGKDNISLNNGKKALKAALELDSQNIIHTDKDFSEKTSIVEASGKEFIIFD